VKFVDASVENCLKDGHINFFHTKGYLIIKNALSPIELQNLQNETMDMIDHIDEFKGDPDYWFNDDIPHNWYQSYSPYESDGSVDSVRTGVPFRIEYPVDKSLACKYLMGHPFVLMATQRLLGTGDFIPTWDSLVFKQPGEGVPIKWHRDASAESVDKIPAIDIGFYLDHANVRLNNCLYVIPGSNNWDDTIASSMIDFLTKDGFKKIGAEPVEVEPGDVVLHNILILHGSPACNSPLRRTVYYEYRSVDQELRMGPHKSEYIPHKKKLLQRCLHLRQTETDYDNQIQFEYEGKLDDFDPVNEPMETMRFSHDEYFRDDYRG